MRKAVSPCRVLIVDDKRVRQDLRVLLELTGAVEIIGEAADGRQALDLASRLCPDVVLLDLEMPGLDSCELTRQIKQQGLARRVVILSVHGETGRLQRAKAAGADAFVLKGDPLDTLLSALVAR